MTDREKKIKERDYRKHKDEYLKELKEYFLEVLEIWTERHSSKYDKKLNDLVIEFISRDYQRIWDLTYFPEYDLPEE